MAMEKHEACKKVCVSLSDLVYIFSSTEAIPRKGLENGGPAAVLG